jgi:hypothetical protein
LGLMHYYLGIEVKQHGDGFILSQENCQEDSGEDRFG